MNFNQLVHLFFVSVFISTTSGCLFENNKSKFFLKYKNVNQDDYFQSSNLYINGEVAGRVTNEQVGTVLLLDKKITLFKTDSVFIKKNPLGTVYFDVVKTNYVKNTTLEYRSGDTIIIYNKANKFTIDGNKAKKIIVKLDYTLKQIDTILKE